MLQALPLVDQGRLCDECVGHFAERHDDRLLVLRDGSFPQGLLRVIGFEYLSTLEDRTRQAASDVPDAEAVVQQVIHIRTLRTVQRRKSDTRKETRHRDTNLSV